MQCHAWWIRTLEPVAIAVLCMASVTACTAESDATRGDDDGNAPRMATPTGGTGGKAPTTTVNNAGNAGSTGAAQDLLPCGGQGCVDASVRAPDDDGFSVAEGDCDDFANSTNPGAFDIPGNGIDEDCKDGDASEESCDDALDVGSTDAFAAARAIELCAKADEDGKQWGVISARWTTANGVGEPNSPLMHGLLPGLGGAFAPRAGKALLAISSGVARAPNQDGFTADCSDVFPSASNAFPDNFNGMSTSCPADAQATSVVDAVALELRVRMPTNATAMSFDSAFFTDEYPVFICSPFNDFFQVIVQPLRMGGGADGNVVFDLDGNAVSVNNSLLRACTPGNFGGKDFTCPLGFAPLMGTGFDDCSANGVGVFGGIFGGLFGGGMQPMDQYGASTGWLSTEMAVEPGEVITLRFAIWDSGDSALDSLSLIDHVRFRLSSEPPPPEVPKTEPVGPD
jgi:hypothetical protein